MGRGSGFKKLIAVSLLAIVCVGGAELAVCRVADPALYGRLTAPVRRAAASVLGAASRGAQTAYDAAEGAAARVWDKASAAVNDTLRGGGEELESQEVLEPDVTFSPPADPTITALELRGEEEVLTGGSWEILYYNQTDEQWRERPYGKDNLGRYGCGPACLSMAVSSLTERKVNPEEMALWAVKNGHWARGGGSYLSIVGGAAAAYGLKAESLPDCDADRLLLELAGGKVAVALMTKGHFTGGGHFILLRGATLGGGVLVADPSSRDRSLAVWDPQTVLDELSKSRSSGAPLWLLSPAEPE